MEPDKKYKIVIMGESRAGKSTLIRRLEQHAFIPNLPSNIGQDAIEVTHNGYKFTFFDTAGQEEYDSMTSPYLRRANAVLLALNPKQGSLKDIERKWLTNITQSVEPGLIIFVGTQWDTWRDRTKEVQNEIQAVANDFKIPHFSYLPTSSLSGDNIEDGSLMQLIISNITNPSNQEPETPRDIKLDSVQETQTKKSCLCT